MGGIYATKLILNMSGATTGVSYRHVTYFIPENGLLGPDVLLFATLGFKVFFALKMDLAVG